MKKAHWRHERNADLSKVGNEESVRLWEKWTEYKQCTAVDKIVSHRDID